MFSGLCGFPITPVRAQEIDHPTLGLLVSRIVSSGASSLGILGSTGGYAYLSRQKRTEIIRTAAEFAFGTPILAGIGALTTDEVLRLADDAQAAGAAGVLLAPLGYHKLTPDEVFGLYQDVTRELSVPLCVYDNPATTGFSFSDDLYARIAELPRVAAIKIPPVPLDRDAASLRINQLGELLPEQVALGISGDASASVALSVGCQSWFSVVGGLLPKTAMNILTAAQNGDFQSSQAFSKQLDPLWDLFRRYGSFRVISAAAEVMGLVEEAFMPRPLLGLDSAARQEVAQALSPFSSFDSV